MFNLASHLSTSGALTPTITFRLGLSDRNNCKHMTTIAVAITVFQYVHLVSNFR